MTLEVVHPHEKLAPESGVEFMPPISGVCVRGLMNGWRAIALALLLYYLYLFGSATDCEYAGMQHGHLDPLESSSYCQLGCTV